MDLKIFSGQASTELTNKICQCLGVSPGLIEFVRFSDGEFKVRFKESVRGSDIYIVQSTYSPTEHLQELLMLIDAAKRAAVKPRGSIIAVTPYFGFARQDRKAEPRVPITAKLVANQIERAGADGLMVFDLHAAQVQGFFDFPVDHLYARPAFVNFFRNHFNPDNFMVIGPDQGAAKIAVSYAQRLNARPLGFAYKIREGPDQIEVLYVMGDFQGKDVLIVDDIVSTGGTIIGLTEKIMERGARDVYAFCTHGVLSGKSVESIEQSPLKKVYITDTIPLKHQSDKIEVISIAPLLAEAIKRSYNNESVSSLFE